MTFINGIDLGDTLELAGDNFSLIGTGIFTDSLDLDDTLELTDGTFVEQGAVIASQSIEIDDTLELSDGTVTLLSNPNTFNIGEIIRVFARPKEIGDDAQEISFDDLTALDPSIYPESTGNPSEYIISKDDFVLDEANDLFLKFKAKL